ncbi:MAG TPA: T9SS type A sorting domain-containing protein [Bacteroidia bacterium]
MKKILLSILLCASTLGAFAQCTPNPNTPNNGNFPKKLDTAWVGIPYNMVVTNAVPLDTTVLVTSVPISVTVDSVKILNFTGLPTGYTKAYNPSSGTYPGGTRGCILISGITNNTALVGVHPLLIYTKSYAKAIGVSQTPQLDTVKSYSLVIAIPNTTDVDDNTDNNLFRLYPNPTNGFFTMNAFLNEANNATVKIFDAMGEMVNKETVSVPNHLLNYTADLSKATPGIYFIEINSPQETIRKKIILKQ